MNVITEAEGAFRETWNGWFLRNVREAQANGFDLCCSCCGNGIHDKSDGHAYWCPLDPEPTGGPGAAASRRSVADLLGVDVVANG